MKNYSDAIVIGGGPSGSFAASKLAKLGADVTVFEEHSEIGVPSHCAGHLSIKGLRNLGLCPLPEKIVENEFCGANFYSPKGMKFSIRLPSPVTCSVDRSLFDKYIAEIARDAGAHYCLGSRVSSLLIEDEFVRSVVVKQSQETEKFSARIVIDAEGISSRILRQTGLSAFNRHGFVYAVEAEAENVKDVECDTVEVFLGKAYAPGFYAWLIPRRDGTAKVGLAAKTGNPKEFLQRLMLKHPVASRQLGTARILRVAFHPMTLGGPIPKTYSNAFLAVGDVASQVKPTTGGGVVFGMTCAEVAAEVAYEALRRNDFSARSLQLYQKRCEEIMGFDMRVMLRIRKMLDAISDEKMDAAIGFCRKMGLEKSLRSVQEIDFQGQTLLRVLKKPRMLTILAYFFLLYLATNP